MVDAFDEALRVIASLNAAGVEHVVIGGVALNVRGLLRATEDLDVFIRPDPENVARLRKALESLWADPTISEITAENLCGDYPAVRDGPPTGDLYLDILTRLGEATAYADLEVEEKDVEGVSVRVATPRTLYRMSEAPSVPSIAPTQRRCERRSLSTRRAVDVPVQKYRSVEDMPRPERVVSADLPDRIRALWRRARLLAPPAPMVRGVTRFRSIEEANLARERATIDRMRTSTERG